MTKNTEEIKAVTVDVLTEFVDDLKERLAKSVQEDKARRFRNSCRKFFTKEEIPYLTLRGHGYVVDVEDGPTDAVLIFLSEGEAHIAPYEPVVEDPEEEDED